MKQLPTHTVRLLGGKRTGYHDGNWAMGHEGDGNVELESESNDGGKRSRKRSEEPAHGGTMVLIKITLVPEGRV